MLEGRVNGRSQSRKSCSFRFITDSIKKKKKQNKPKREDQHVNTSVHGPFERLLRLSERAERSYLSPAWCSEVKKKPNWELRLLPMGKKWGRNRSKRGKSWIIQLQELFHNLLFNLLNSYNGGRLVWNTMNPGFWLDLQIPPNLLAQSSISDQGNKDQLYSLEDLQDLLGNVLLPDPTANVWGSKALKRSESSSRTCTIWGRKLL